MSFRKVLLCLIVCFSLSACSSSDLSEYSWGSALQEKLDEIGVKKIKNIQDETFEETKGIIARVKIETDTKTLDILLDKGTDYKWNVLSIEDSETHEIYYEVDYLQLNQDGTQRDDMYDDATGNIVKRKELGPSTNTDPSNPSKEEADPIQN